MNLKEVIDIWLPEKKRQVKESSYSLYKHLCLKTLIPILGDMEIGTIDKFVVREFAYRELETKTAKTVKEYLMTLKMIMKYANEELAIAIPPLNWNIIWPSGNLDNNKIQRYSPRQIKMMIDYIADNPSYSTISLMIAITTGMRIGEICALKFSDIDFNKSVIHVTKTRQRIMRWDDYIEGATSRTKMIEEAPKTRSSRRDVPITPKLKKMLMAFYKISKPDFYISTGSKRGGDPHAYRTVARRIIEASGVSPVLNFHALRHTFATTLIENKIDPKTVSEILGHSDVSTTLDLYVHPSDSAKANAVRQGLKGIM